MIDAPSPSVRRFRMRLLWPKEHGAYGQLLFPTATALVIGNHGGSAFALAGASVAVFIGHEAVLTVLGQRGGRAARDRHADAVFSLVCCAAIAAVLGAWATAHMSPSSRLAIVPPLGLAAVLAAFIWFQVEHSTAGEIVAAATLSSCGVPIARAGGVEPSRALICWVVFALSFTVATLAVRSAIARIRNVPRRQIPSAAWPAPATIALSLVSASRGWIPPAASLAVLPVCGLALGLSLFPPHPRHLRAVGWSLVTATAITAIVLAVSA